MAARAGEQGVSRRARLARMLATRSDTLMLLSATPHDGSARSFASLMSLLDPTAISDPDDYTPEDFRDKGLVIRRFKKDIRDQVKDDFQERVTDLPYASRQAQQEEAAYRALLDDPVHPGGANTGPANSRSCSASGMQKALFSSPAAALESTRKRIDLLQQEHAHAPTKVRRWPGSSHLRRAGAHRQASLQQVPAAEAPPARPVVRLVTDERRRIAS